MPPNEPTTGVPDGLFRPTQQQVGPLKPVEDVIPSTPPCMTPIDLLALVLWIGWLHILAVIFLVIAITFPSPLSVALIVGMVTLALLPVDLNGPLARAYCRFVIPRATRYFPIRVVFEDEAAIDHDKAYIIGLEPHSVLPISLVGLTDLPQFRRTFCGATSAIFRVPIIKHTWQWLRLTPASKGHLTRLLQQGSSVIVVPGGVQECLYMEHGKEIAFLKKRFGFIRLAIEQGAPLIPMFSFGQSDAYHFWKPSGWWHSMLSRRLGFAPMLFWGRWGSFIPFQSRMTVCVGQPIPVGEADPKPSHEKIADLHAQFIAAMQKLFNEHRKEAGYGETELQIM